ncbi:hypothetical protein, partial [Pseudomonas sp. FW300-N1A5]|uniref:hypothetical protein n=1 Tax=Pseudomonas sp. FW300-N1A5 TaxID=2070664 RepID=UPI000CB9C690
VAELLASDPIKFVHSAAGALSSLKEEKNIAMRLSFLRDVDESKIRSSFREGLVANKVDLSDVAIHALLEGIFATGPIREGDTVMI